MTLKSKIAGIKQRFGAGTERTKVFDNWEQSIKDFLLARVPLLDDEMPVLAHYKTDTGMYLAKVDSDPVSWCLLTSRRVVWRNPDGQIFELYIADIERVEFSSGPDWWPLRDPDSEPDNLVFVSDEKTMLYLIAGQKSEQPLRGSCGRYSPWLYVIDTGGRRYEIFLEVGHTKSVKYAIWFLVCANRNRYETAKTANRFADENLSEPTGSDRYKARRFSHNINDKYRNHLFGALPDAERDLINTSLELYPEEICVFAFIEDEANWLAMTTRRIVWKRQAVIYELEYTDINKIGMTEIERLENEKVPPNTSASEFWEKRRIQLRGIKLSATLLYFEDHGGARYEAFSPPGILSVVWNATELMIRLARIHPVTSLPS